ncbi:hypothetical protein C0J52_05670 [Blattella germanica]|nr:hypothetical protein C0J52_05670 [Blattella germanica]
MADRLAKKAAVEEGEIVFHKIPRDIIVSEEKIKSLQRWQLQWNESTKGPITRLFFPTIKERLKIKVPIGVEYTAMVTGHGLTRSYLHRFKLIPDPLCSCNLREDQTIHHIILNCTHLEHERRTLRSELRLRGQAWPPLFEHLTTKYLKNFNKFINSIDFSKL